MIIAVPYENEEIFQHFGHTEQFKLYAVFANEIVNTEIFKAPGSGHEALAAFLADFPVDAVVCGSIGPGAYDAMAAGGIRVFPGVQGNADKAVHALLNGTLIYDETFNCDHHSAGGCGHGCGGCHGCH